MSDKIQLLPDHVANQIAAGEVIQRPASVVKELMENAIDAQATHIQLLLKEAGKTLVQVIDNGEGMSATDLRMAFERHATSKIKKAEDLFALTTKGFRGEALASIAAIAHVETHTRRSQDEMASQIIIEGSEVVQQDLVVAPQGTSFAVKNLFFNIPARRNFLKSNTVELRHVIDEFHRIAIAYPQIHFTMLHNGAELFDLPPENLRRRIAGIFGAKTAEKLVPVEEQTSVTAINGFIVKPEFAKKTRGHQYFFVNNRFIKSPFLHHAVLAAFEGLLQQGYHPGYFLFLQLDPKTLDINIHPTKTEIKFEDEQSIYAILKAAIKHALGMFQVAPVLDFDRDPSMDVSYHKQQTPAKIPAIEVDASFNPFRAPGAKPKTIQWESLYTQTETTQIESETPADDLGLETIEQPKVFQLLNKYIVSSTRAALLVIHQQRAHERILYERFLKNLSLDQHPSQQLLFPVKMKLNPAEKAVYENYETSLTSMGFELEFDFESDTLEIKGIPVLCQQKEVAPLLEAVLAIDTFEGLAESFSASDRLAKVLAQTTSIKTGKVLSMLEQQALVDDLFACKEPLKSPFNRQIFITLSKEEFDQKFN